MVEVAAANERRATETNGRHSSTKGTSSERPAGPQDDESAPCAASSLTSASHRVHSGATKSAGAGDPSTVAASSGSIRSQARRRARAAGSPGANDLSQGSRSVLEAGLPADRRQAPTLSN